MGTPARRAETSARDVYTRPRESYERVISRGGELLKRFWARSGREIEKEKKSRESNLGNIQNDDGSVGGRSAGFRCPPLRRPIPRTCENGGILSVLYGRRRVAVVDGPSCGVVVADQTRGKSEENR